MGTSLFANKVFRVRVRVATLPYEYIVMRTLINGKSLSSLCIGEFFQDQSRSIRVFDLKSTCYGWRRSVRASNICK